MAIKGGIDLDYKGALKGAVYMFSGLNNVIDPYNLPLDKGFLPKAENVDIDNTNSISRRDGYTSVIATTKAHSGWSNNAVALFVDDVYLKSFNGTTTTLIDVVTPNKKMYYVQANDVVIYSNGIESGVIGGSFSQTGVYSEYFKETTDFGICLEFYNGRVYHAKENSVYCTDTFDVEHSDIRFKHVATFKDAVTMIRRVEDGLFIGTLSNVFFLKGNDIIEGGFDQEIKANYGVVRGTDISTTGEYIPEAKATDEVVIFTTVRGICSGGAGGNFQNHSVGIVSIPEAIEGTALLRDKGGIRQYITTLTNATSNYNPYPSNTFDTDIIT